MTVVPAQIRISDDEYKARCNHLLEHIQAKGLGGVVIFEVDYVKYYSGFAFIPTERPIVFMMNARGERGLFVPRLEYEHATNNAIIDHVGYYIEYPDIPHPLQKLKIMLEEMGFKGDIAADNDGYPWIFGYRGPQLSELTGKHVVLVRDIIEDQMMIKSAAEINLIRESCKWANMAHMLLQRYTQPGLTETEVTQRASNEATRAMYDAIGPLYRGQNEYANGVTAGYRGQIGRNAAIPHALGNNITFQAGDTLVTGATAAMWGYLSELERTMFMGAPSDAQKRLFDHMVTLQDLAMNAIEPGKTCADVDTEVQTYFDKHSLRSYWKHHTGHCIGLRYHEGPFLDLGDDTEIKTGMVFTVEPGLYAEQLGGFRHSDTLVVTENGTEMLTYYPRDLESLIIPV